MKKLLFLSLLTLIAFVGKAQHGAGDKAKRPSPPATATATVNGATIKIDYSQPSVKGRNVWAGDLAPYGKVWRTGANEATVFEVSKDVTVEGKALKAGKYALFSIPNEKEWVIIFNKKSNQWGAYDYKESDDALRVTVPAKAGALTEKFTITAENSGKVTLAWDKAAVAFNVK